MNVTPGPPSGSEVDWPRRLADAPAAILERMLGELDDWQREHPPGILQVRITDGLFPPRSPQFSAQFLGVTTCGPEVARLTRLIAAELADRMRSPPVAPPDVADRPDPTPPVLLKSPADPPVVLGAVMPRLTRSQFAVVKALIEAGDRGLTGDELANKSGREGAVKVLKRLARSSSEWGAVIPLPGMPGVGYRIGVRKCPELSRETAGKD